MRNNEFKWYLLFTGQFGYPQPEEDFGYLKITYDPNQGCPKCNIGIKQIQEFRFRSQPKAKHSHFLGLNWVFDQIFVRTLVKQELERSDIKGIYFSSPVIHKTNIAVDGIFQVHIDTFLPDGLLDDNLTREVCEYPKDKKELKFIAAHNRTFLEGSFCGQIKYNYPQKYPIKYNSSAFVGMPDFIRIKNWFGSGGSASQPVIISQKVKNIIDQNKWRGVFLSDVELV